MCRPAFWSTEKNRKIHIRIVEIYYTPVKEKKKLMWPGVELIYEIWWTFDDIWMIYFYIWRKYNERMEIIKRGSLLGNEEPDFWGDSQVFDFFSFGPPYVMKKMFLANKWMRKKHLLAVHNSALFDRLFISTHSH